MVHVKEMEVQIWAGERSCFFTPSNVLWCFALSSHCWCSFYVGMVCLHCSSALNCFMLQLAQFSWAKWYRCVRLCWYTWNRFIAWAHAWVVVGGVLVVRFKTAFAVPEGCIHLFCFVHVLARHAEGIWVSACVLHLFIRLLARDVFGEYMSNHPFVFILLYWATLFLGSIGACYWLCMFRDVVFWLLNVSMCVQHFQVQLLFCMCPRISALPVSMHPPTQRYCTNVTRVEQVWMPCDVLWCGRVRHTCRSSMIAVQQFCMGVLMKGSCDFPRTPCHGFEGSHDCFVISLWCFAKCWFFHV